MEICKAETREDTLSLANSLMDVLKFYRKKSLRTNL
jgi:hypothetical protein